MSADAGEAVIRQTIDAFYHAFEARSVELLRKVVTPDWQYLPEPPGVSYGPDQMVPVFEKMAAALPDMKIHILDVLIHGERVGVRAEISGTQTGELLGIAASAKPIRFAIHSFHQLRGNLIEKTWHMEDWLAIFRQIGQLPTSLDAAE